VLVATVALAATACGGSSRPRTTSAAAAPKCSLSAKQHRAIRRARHEIALMRRLERPLNKWKPTGPEPLELAVNRFLLDIGVLPVDERGLLIRKAKAATGLCGDCFQALEALEPATQTRLGESPCKPGF
jgi:hypothetical protein